MLVHRAWDCLTSWYSCCIFATCNHVLPNSWPYNKTHALSPVAVLVRVAGNLSTVRHLHVLVSPEQRPPYFSLTIFRKVPPSEVKVHGKLFHFPTAATQHVAKAIHTYLGKIHWSLHGETMTLHHNCTQASKAGKLLKGHPSRFIPIQDTQAMSMFFVKSCIKTCQNN